MSPRIFKVLILFSIILTGMEGSIASAENDNQVILISFDGMRNDLTRKYVKDGKLPHIEEVIKDGTIAKYAKTVSPSLTAPSHAAIATGATPLKTSIVSNVWQEPDEGLTNKQDAFLSKLEVDPLWVAARKQGKTTATVAFAGANPQTGKQADYTIYYGDTWSPSSQEKLTFTEAIDWKHSPQSYSPLKESSFSIKVENGKNQTIHVLAYDSTNDQEVNYNQFIVAESKEADAKAVQNKSWGSVMLEVKEGKTAGFWFKLSLQDQKLENGALIYRSAVTSGLIDGPEGFSEEIRNRFGFFPPQDDDTALEEGWISRKEYEQITERFVNWVTDVSLFIKNEYEPDLLMFYAPQIDHQEHKYLLTDPRQPDYTPEMSKKYMEYIEWAYQTADQVVGKTVKSLDENDHLFIVSDHGMEPAHSALEPNKVLKDNGLLVLDSKGKIDYEKTKAIAIPSGSAAHVYINLESREKAGIVPQQDYEKVREEIIQSFNQVEVNRNENGPVVSHHLKEMWDSMFNEGLSLTALKENSRDLYGYLMNSNIHPYQDIKKIPKKGNSEMKDQNEGDILLMAAPGYIMGEGMSEIVKPSPELGTHGGDPNREKLKAVFMAMGPEIDEGKQIQPTSNLDIAPTIYEILGLETPSFVEGKPIEKLRVR
ncbi:alkaline phosphatase family protein [Mesobacillus subterraneus]|uniref:alkaline phosphatase family protein n=1 Tax=Mesobacillus subterraneus TaxID=285983 RepID=UPI00203E5FFF|nr:alkaline phosphatase family protein [Mesobacillus subterraneus]MCM3666222.1 alkaline phosphatase family protein [Mesobacillus subterraneus]MCM3685221.1 alkaline phosphatase family protein [Mesobacillus subterraneus]